jgi:hypothetical protein
MTGWLVAAVLYTLGAVVTAALVVEADTDGRAILTVILWPVAVFLALVVPVDALGKWRKLWERRQ